MVCRAALAFIIAINSLVSLGSPLTAHAATVPDVPQNVVHTFGLDYISLSWAQPLDDGGSVLTGYWARIRLHGDSLWSSIHMDTNQTSIQFAGLTPEATYDVAVASKNALGSSADVEISSIKIGAAPDEVDGFSFINNDSTLAASWQAPANVGSSPLSEYEFAYSLAGQNSWSMYSLVPASTTAGINGVLPGRYDVRVRAINSYGAGDWSYVYNQYLGPYYYDITTCDQLQAMHNALDAAYHLAQDIDCTNVDFEPIGDNTQPFIGSLDGHGYAIHNLTVDAPSDYLGLFGVIDSATIENLTMNGEVHGGSYSGGLVGKVTHTAVISHVTANVLVAGGDYTGGLVGYSEGTDASHHLQITDSQSSGVVTGGEAVGGLVGYADYTTVLRSNATGMVTSTGDYAGGLIGRSKRSLISQSYATGSVISEATRAGGLIGESESDEISDSYARGDATTPNIYYAGGLIGAMNTSSLLRVYSTGVVNGYGIIGGLVGYNVGASSITDSFSASYVLPDGNSWDMRSNNGLVGIDYGNTITYDNVYFNSINNAINCSRDNNFDVISSQDCTGINLQFHESQFKQADDAPISSWDFGGIWHLTGTDFPTLSPSTQPYILCEQPTSTDTTIGVYCLSAPDGWGDTTWEMQYKRTADSSWVNVPLNDLSEARATITGLTPGTDYQVRFRFTNDWGVGQWGRQDITTTGVAPLVSPPASPAPLLATSQVAVIKSELGKVLLDEYSAFLNGAEHQLVLELNQVVYFYVGSELHSATVKEIGADYVVLTVASRPFDVRLKLGESKELSVYQNGSKDVRIALVGITGGKATLAFAKPAGAQSNSTDTASLSTSTSSTPRSPLTNAWWLLAILAPAIGYGIYQTQRKYR